ncbi:MAG: hypothetical protein K0Q68_1611 [Moraxellaceae bacterium]|jgi:ergothioneine biosynthesis protein EgtB|nr:hypothetical protein [Moraxellaceae bacterium]
MTSDNAPWMQQGELLDACLQVRRQTLALAEGLSAEDCLLQSMTEASPVKWHLAHTTWFFETFVLARAESGFQPWQADWLPLFNSYYLRLGQPFARDRRGLLSRPSLAEVLAWRDNVDARLQALLATPLAPEVQALLELGLHHEEQHQELILTDIKHHFWCNPLHPAYRPDLVPVEEEEGQPPAGMAWREFAGGLVAIGNGGDAGEPGFGFDNERPRHPAWLAPFALASRLVTNSEFLAFMLDGGYGRPELWLSDGWAECLRAGWHSPLYWFRHEERWWQFTLTGARPVRMDEPVCHVSHFEAAAYARWARARLPTEMEWEYVASLAAETAADAGEDGPTLFTGLHPAPPVAGESQFRGAVWQWTASAYLPYPGYREPAGAVGEYNGKFMSGQMVLRGASCVTPPRQWRCSFRNFFPPASRWQFTGIRLARDAVGTATAPLP